MLAIREVTVQDLPEVRKLLKQLGYDLSVTEVGVRFEAVAGAADHSLFVEEQDGQVIALLHVFARPALDKPPQAIVQALVVAEVARGSGAGRRLMETAERWAGQRGFTSVALTSHITRFGAHAFYERLGYRIEATSHLMRKRLTQ
jgi:GNAT superfamily N-acetyltransferase